MLTLLDADIKQEEENRQQFRRMWNIVIPLVAPIAIGTVLPVLPLSWWALGLVVSVINGQFSPIRLAIALIASYLIFSSMIWMGMEWVRRKYNT